MIDIVLYEPEIPPNTGNILRLAHNGGFGLHLVGKLGFELDDKRLRRAGLDYIRWNSVMRHQSWQDYLRHFENHPRILALSTKGKKSYHQFAFQAGDQLLFGPETRGLPDDVRNGPEVHQVLNIPMLADSRSLNLSNSVAIVAFEAWRQLDFDGAVNA